ncbi:hypothetical protein EVAR_43823_1 [Eumeta japonica]|uniref:Nucleic-acid-binding protein from transposon X-element n=1 Tax=Eumeta variegata TaxID=151549 RepID=A0A4C1WXH2_EUMVA|nr:hypothetical protein EVAR_43823_1 [Eumeta japonica]
MMSVYPLTIPLDRRLAQVWTSEMGPSPLDRRDRNPDEKTLGGHSSSGLRFERYSATTLRVRRPTASAVKCAATSLRLHLSRVQCTWNKDTDGPPACVLCKQKDHTANYLRCPHAPKRAPPHGNVSPRRATARTVSNTLTYARAATGPRSVPPTTKLNQFSTADDLKQLLSIILVIDTNELAILARKFRAAANPTEKLSSLVEQASILETIKSSKFYR